MPLQAAAGRRGTENAQAPIQLSAAEPLPTDGGEGCWDWRAKACEAGAQPPAHRRIAGARSPDQGSYTQTTEGLIRMALVLEGYLDKKLGAGEARKVRRLVRRHILVLPDDAPAPVLTGSWERAPSFSVAPIRAWRTG